MQSLLAIKAERPVRFSLIVHPGSDIFGSQVTQLGACKKIFEENNMLFITAYWSKYGSYNMFLTGWFIFPFW